MRRLALIHEDGITTTKSGAIGVGFAGGGLGIGAAASLGLNQSATSARLAPLMKEAAKVSVVGELCLGVILAAMAARLHPAGVAVVLVATLVYCMNKSTKLKLAADDRNAKAMDQWNRSYMCERCGDVFEAA